MEEIYLLALSFFGVLYCGVAIMFVSFSNWMKKQRDEHKREIEELRGLLHNDFKKVLDNFNKLLKQIKE